MHRSLSPGERKKRLKQPEVNQFTILLENLSVTVPSPIMRIRNVKVVSSWIFRALLLLVCGFIAARSIHIAIADMSAQQSPQGLDRALRLEPGDSVLLARAALTRNADGDTSQAADQQLLRASEADPFNSEVLMALGLREEFRGHAMEAERYLTRATEVDRTFKPAWTLANYYLRTNQTEKMWPVIGGVLALNPLAIDARPVFDLCWNAGSDSKIILGLLPARGTIPVQYLYWLMGKNKIDAAIEFWPRMLAAPDAANADHVDVLTTYTEFLEQANRVTEAVHGWNQLVERKIVISGRLDPAAGVSVADPDFSFPLIERGFGWRLTRETGISVAKGSAGLRFELDGNEPESSALLSTATPLLPGRTYRLVWKIDTSQLSSRRDPGFVWHIVQQPGDAVTVCQPALQSGDEGVCQFTSGPRGNARIELFYSRASGTTRIEGMFRIMSVRLEFGS